MTQQVYASSPAEGKRNSSKLLINERPLQLLPSLAKAIGLNEAVFLQQVHFWLGVNEDSDRHGTHFIDGRWWTYNTFEEWQKKNFPFWSIITIKRTVASLIKQGVLISAYHSPDPRNRTKWYTIDYDALERLEVEPCIVSTRDDGDIKQNRRRGSK